MPWATDGKCWRRTPPDTPSGGALGGLALAGGLLPLGHQLAPTPKAAERWALISQPFPLVLPVPDTPLPTLGPQGTQLPAEDTVQAPRSHHPGNTAVAHVLPPAPDSVQPGLPRASSPRLPACCTGRAGSEQKTPWLSSVQRAEPSPQSTAPPSSTRHCRTAWG